MIPNPLSGTRTISRPTIRALRCAIEQPLLRGPQKNYACSRQLGTARWRDITARTGGSVVKRAFSSTPTPKAKNRIYDAVRRPSELETYILASTTSKTPLLTLWTASYCPSCTAILPLVRSLIESGAGEAQGGVLFCEVEFDSQEMMESGMGMRYMITGLPTLVAFGTGPGEVVEGSRVADVRLLKQKEWVRDWIEREAGRRDGGWGGGGGGGGGMGMGLFGGLFGDRR